MATTDALSGNERLIEHGGLMRCCTKTLRMLNEPTMTGDRTDCRWCGTKMWVNEAGNWAWDPTDKPRTV